MLPTENQPDTLLYLCLDYLSDNLQLMRNVSLPRKLCEALVTIHTSAGKSINGEFCQIFSDPSRTKLKEIYLQNSALTRDGLDYLLQHKLTHLDVSRCSLTPTSLLQQISLHGEKLQELSVGSWKKIEHFPGGFENSPELRKLEIYKWHDFGNSLTLPILLKPLTKLVCLNLSRAFGGNDLSCLLTLPHLQRLFLYKLRNHNLDRILTILKLKNLTHLDISGAEKPYECPDEILSSIVDELPNLVYLDISETNLAGRGVDTKCRSISDIKGLRSRVNNPLLFLGLYDTSHGACYRQNIPAKNISGEADELQLLLAARIYLHRPKLLEKILNKIYNCSRENESIINTNELLEVILMGMERHQRKKSIQISGSATLYFIVRKREHELPVKVKQRIIRVLLNGMVTFQADQFMLRNCCLCLCQFKIPQDVLFEYPRLVTILLYVAIEMNDALFIQRIAIYILNSLACQVDGPHKHMLGAAGAVPKMLSLISDRLTQGVCDDVMEVAWSTLWNLTDQTGINCEVFLNCEGMYYFCACLKAFPGKSELLRNMMGLLGNVAEVPELRPRLMAEEFVKVFLELLKSTSDGIEVSYNAAGVLAHLCSDGENAWTISIEREEVLEKMFVAINTWDITSERNINYRSFEPILGLLKITHTPQCQLWAAWALANLTKVYPNKYCSLVEEEGGLELLAYVGNKCKLPSIRELALTVIDNCQRYKNNNYSGVELDG